jgi:hypothetical protein
MRDTSASVYFSRAVPSNQSKEPCGSMAIRRGPFPDCGVGVPAAEKPDADVGQTI